MVLRKPETSWSGITTKGQNKMKRKDYCGVHNRFLNTCTLSNFTQVCFLTQSFTVYAKSFRWKYWIMILSRSLPFFVFSISPVNSNILTYPYFLTPWDFISETFWDILPIFAYIQLLEPCRLFSINNFEKKFFQDPIKSSQYHNGIFPSIKRSYFWLQRWDNKSVCLSINYLYLVRSPVPLDLIPVPKPKQSKIQKSNPDWGLHYNHKMG